MLDMSHILSTEGDPLPCIDAIQVHSDGVADLLSNINLGKSGSHGHDNLLAEVFSSEIAPALTLIFRRLDQGTLEAGHSCSCFQKSKCTDPCNYRLMSLICICTNLLEHM